jgi:carbohydrate-selective porin OprB
MLTTAAINVYAHISVNKKRIRTLNGWKCASQQDVQLEEVKGPQTAPGGDFEPQRPAE